MDETLKITEETAETAESAENVSRETESAENEKKPVTWSAEYVLTDEEIKDFIVHSGMISDKKKTVIQGGLAAILCVVNAVSYATGEKKMALFLAIVCGVLCGMVFITPWYNRRTIFKQMKAAAEQGRPTRVACDGTQMTFGAGEETLAYDYESLTIKQFGDMVTVATPDGQMVCLPERAVEGDGWNDLCSRAVNA